MSSAPPGFSAENLQKPSEPITNGPDVFPRRAQPSDGGFRFALVRRLNRVQQKGGASAPPCDSMIYYFILCSVDCTYLSKICFLRFYTLIVLWTVPTFQKIKPLEFMCTSDDTSLSITFAWFLVRYFI